MQFKHFETDDFEVDTSNINLNEVFESHKSISRSFSSILSDILHNMKMVTVDGAEKIFVEVSESVRRSLRSKKW